METRCFWFRVQPVLNLPHSRANLNLRFLWCCFIFFLTIRETISYRFILLNPPPTIYLESDLHARPWNCDYKKVTFPIMGTISSFHLFKLIFCKMAKATIFLSDLKTGRVRHNRRRKAVATEERRIKAMRDQPCPVWIRLFIVIFPSLKTHVHHYFEHTWWSDSYLSELFFLYISSLQYDLNLLFIIIFLIPVFIVFPYTSDWVLCFT